ncbi:MAG: DUF86 domain-containing protein [Cyanobacteria bacterium RM1_2_2]|nr:DUF86 domain-containing protein [Cyanobacteria bacterium RM1_2_2]
MSRDTQALLDMRESAQLAVRYLAEKSIDDFLGDVQLQDSVIRRLELIGEAARRVSETTRQTLAEIPWNEINGMRNRLIHLESLVRNDIGASRRKIKFRRCWMG